MANYEAVTVSSYDVVIPEAHREALEEVLRRYAFSSELTVGLEQDGTLVAYGYEPFEVYSRLPEPEEGDEDGNIDYDSDATDECLQALCPFIPEGREWKVAQVGFEKCRYVTGWCATVTCEGVTHQYLEAP